MTKQEIQSNINELQKQLDKCPEVEPFTCKGDWYTKPYGAVYEEIIVSNKPLMAQAFNYWQTKEIAEKVYQLQLRHRKMLSFVSQHQELGDGMWCIYKKDNWVVDAIDIECPDTVMMTKETAELMIEAIENGSLNLEEKENEA